MGTLALLLSAVLFVPQPGSESQAPILAATMEASASVGDMPACVPARGPCPGGGSESPCSPDDGCCASCVSPGKQLASTPAIPGPAQEPAAAGRSLPAPRVGGDYERAVWHPPRG